MLAILSNLVMFLFQYSNKTPHVNPSNTPYPDTVLGDTPDFMYSWWFIGICCVGIVMGIIGFYRHVNKVPGKGYINRQ